jgi:glycerol-3-phosphate acyltransferase PlsY
MFWIVVAGYLIGSIPFAYLLARRVGGVDIRIVGSGNVGAANLVRVTGLAVGVTAALLDMAKGSAVILLAHRIGADETLKAATGLAAVVGHIYPVWLRFRGGKGVATACGVFAVLVPAATAIAAALFVASAWITRYVSLGSIVATVALGPLAIATNAPQPVLVAIGAAATLILFRHRSNLARLQAGTERRL